MPVMTSVIKGVWQQLPVNLRRRLAYEVLSLSAPKLPAIADASLVDDAPVVVVGFLTSASGLGQAARLAYVALERQGRVVFGVDLSRFFFESADAVQFAFRDGRTHRGPGRVLININAPYLKYVYRLLGSSFLAGKHVTGYWAWELPLVPEGWREGLERVHAIAVPSRFVANAILSLGPVQPIKVAPHPVLLEELPSIALRAQPVSERSPFEIVCALNSASGFARKNPLAAIAAFKEAFPGNRDVRLRMLVSNIEHYPPGRDLLIKAAGGDRRIVFTFDVLGREAYWRWYGAPDLYVSLHRAEGFGLPLAESMAIGVPVLATNWSANSEYMNACNAILIGAKLVAVRDPQGRYASSATWAEPDIVQAALQMRRAFEETGWLGALARAGQEHARRLFSIFEPFD